MEIKYIEDRIDYITNFSTAAALDSKTKEVKGEIPSISDLATSDVLSAVENEISDVKADYDAKISEMRKKSTSGNKKLRIMYLIQR